MEEGKEIETLVSGKVQMVMYRDFVQRKARALGLRGFVENVENGSVRVVAQGLEKDLKKLIEHLHKGPFMARVARVDVSWRTPTDTFDGFVVHY